MPRCLNCGRPIFEGNNLKIYCNLICFAEYRKKVYSKPREKSLVIRPNYRTNPFEREIEFYEQEIEKK